MDNGQPRKVLMMSSLMSRPSKIEESRTGVVASWATLIASFLLSFETWDKLAVLSGWLSGWKVLGVVPVWLSWALPVAVDGFVVGAMMTWLHPGIPKHISDLAKRCTYGVALVGIIAQSAYHALTVPADSEAWLPYLAAGVGVLPPLLSGLGIHLRALIRQHAGSALTTPVPVSVPDVVPVSVPDIKTDTVPTVRNLDVPDPIGQDTHGPGCGCEICIKIAEAVSVPDVVPVSVPVQRARASRVAWDAAKLFQACRENTNDAEVAALVGIGYKTVQRARRAMSLIEGKPGITDAEVSAVTKVGIGQVAAIRQEVLKS